MVFDKHGNLPFEPLDTEDYDLYDYWLPINYGIVNEPTKSIDKDILNNGKE